MKKVAVVILNWNGKRHLEQFLPSVVKYNPHIAEIIVADNASTDDSVAFVEKNFPSISIIKNNENGGFSKGYNDALKQVKTEYYVLLNSDVEVTENWIESIIEIMDKDKSIAACQPKILDFKNKSYFEYAGASGGFIDSLGYPYCRGRIFNELEKDTQQYNDVIDVFWATGACMFVRAEVYHKLGGLDEDFFAHMEEIDLCWRMQNMGYRIKACPTSTVYHVGGGTLSKISPQKTFLNFRNNLLLLSKNVPSNKLFPVIFYRMILDGIAAFKFLFAEGFGHFTAVIKAHFSFYGLFSANRKKRKEFTFPERDTVYTKVKVDNLVWEFYTKKKKKYSEL